LAPATAGAERGPPSDNLPKATDFADVNIEQDFTEPVWLPPPSTTIEGDATSLVGSWIQVRSDGSPCSPRQGLFTPSTIRLQRVK
jgi:hypothetical protein